MVRTLTAEVTLAGRAGSDALRGTVRAGFGHGGAMRLELRAGPFGTVGFVLVARDGRATLWLPRDNRVVRDAPAGEMVEALTGLPLGPADLQAILTGCVVSEPRAVAGRQHAGGWVTLDLEGGARMFVQRDHDRWRIRAARRGDLQVEYPEWPRTSTLPARVRLQADRPVSVDLRASLAQAEVNTDLADNVFTIQNLSPAAEPMTVGELREHGPLREAR
jgi:hypothetical protein